VHHLRDWYSSAAVDFGWVRGGPSRTGGRRENTAVVFDRRATKHPAKIRAALRVGAAPAPRRVAGSLNRTSAIRLASALPVIRWRSQRCYPGHGSGALACIAYKYSSAADKRTG
jgi:hypothetical protein